MCADKSSDSVHAALLLSLRITPCEVAPPQDLPEVVHYHRRPPASEARVGETCVSPFHGLGETPCVLYRQPCRLEAGATPYTLWPCRDAADKFQK